MERHGADLEQQANGNHHQSRQQQHPRRLVLDDGLRHPGVAEGRRVPVQQGHAEQEERGAESPEQEVLQRRLLAQPAPPPRHPAKQVERQREDLQGDEQRQQVVRGREQQHPEQGEQQKREDLGVLVFLTLRLPLQRRPGDGGCRGGEG